MPTHELETIPEVTLHVVAAFTRGEDGGNLAGVVLDADGLAETHMQAIAADAGYSETVFVSRLTAAGARLDFFTPTRRIADCGHATVAAFWLLRETGRIRPGKTSKEIQDGVRRIVVTDNEIFMAQREPRYRFQAEWTGVRLTDVLAALGLTPSQLDATFEPLIADAGGPFIMIALRGEADLAGVVPDQAALLAISETLDLTGFYLFAADPASGAGDVTTRMFAPRYGIPEESATGMAAGALGAVLHDIAGRPGPEFRIEQGRHMRPASPSLLKVRLGLSGDGHARDVMTGGAAALRAARQVAAPPSR
ncbi:Phenazine biosynthesis protein PhzF like [Hartmannibacter diazotrophicus]|uniref:Phenazine biosynthesis protein PhzF like n=1 Tax=Hartmannibacter diazotrophicus TaxID=1482074 RepID=A0A2C9D8Y9_9HYPH|nr:PhzF family phenazine biosynthesis protein [Hartmannibacter diazotrophicus]SON56726.1 Phenazine biosynthesis protein PhzF like [Hartmannibacter diazotrophicus]